MTKHTIKLTVLRMIKEMGELTASQIPYSNGNQYLIPLEEDGLIIRKWSKEGKRCKIARLNPKKLNEILEIIEPKATAKSIAKQASKACNAY